MLVKESSSSLFSLDDLFTYLFMVIAIWFPVLNRFSPYLKEKISLVDFWNSFPSHQFCTGYASWDYKNNTSIHYFDRDTHTLLIL